MQKIKLLYITQSFGGVFTYIRQIVERINKKDFEISVIAPPDEEFEKFAKDWGVKYYKVKMCRGFNPLTDIKNIFEFRTIIKKESADIIHLHSSKAGFIGRIAASQLKKKSIFTPHGISYLSFTGKKRSVFFALETFAKRYTNRVLACSNSEAFRLNFEVGINQNKIETLQNAIPINTSDCFENKYFNKDSKIRIGVIARLTYQKNPLLFVEVANVIIRKYPNAEFSILGAGLEDHLKAKTNDLIAKYGIANKLKILEWGDSNVSDTYLNNLDIFLMTSIFEGLPFSLIEAMSKGILCITSKCDGCNDVIQNNENGFSCMTRDQFVNAISRVIENESLQMEIRKQGVKYVKEHHNIDSFIINLEKYYQKVYNDPYHF